MTTKTLLLVEDDPAIATSLRITFKREGWQMLWYDRAALLIPELVSLCHRLANDNDANKQTTTAAHLPAAIILDVGLPDGDGLQLCQQIRHHPNLTLLQAVPIVFLTARNDEVDRIIGLEMGADDYCSKPFSPRELVARIKAIWRREQLLHGQQNKPNLTAQPIQNGDISSAPNQAEQYFYLASGTWCYQPQQYRLYWQNHKLNLSQTERLLMLSLLQSPNRVLSREQLLNAISDYPDHRLARTIDSHIKSIRKQLADIEQKTVIYTHRGIGYGLCPP